MTMRFLEEVPELEYGSGQFWSHPTGGEHNDKFTGIEHAYNPLREANLIRGDGQAISPITGEEMTEMLLGDDHEVIFVDRRNGPKGSNGLVAATVAERHRTGQFEKRLKITEMVVDPSVRRQGAASYMLGRATTLESYGALQPTELVIDTTAYQIPTWFAGKLHEAGFRHSDENGSPALWLPGNKIDLSGVDDTTLQVPEGWNGSQYAYTEAGVEARVFRAGLLVGSVASAGHFRYDDYDRRVADFRAFDAGNTVIGTLSGTTPNEATLALLNNYELIA
jgi:hypothetical protein